MKIKRILLLTDFSECSRQAYAPAADLARQHDATVLLTNGLQFPLNYVAMDFYASSSAMNTVREQAEEQLARETELDVFEKLDVSTQLLEGYAPTAILEYAKKESADWIILGSHGRSGVRHLLLGSFAEKIIRQASVPVLAVREAVAAFQPRRILVPYDFSPVSEEILDMASDLSRTYDATITLLHVWNDLFGMTSAHGTAVVSMIAEKLEVFAKERLEGLPVQTQVMRGNPARKILAWAEASDVDLICMATHGSSGIEHWVLGSVTERVLRGAHCPVLTLRPSKEHVEAELAEYMQTGAKE